LLPIIERYEVTTFCAPPTVYRMLILADLDKFDFRDLRHCCSAGEPLNPEVIRVWQYGHRARSSTRATARPRPSAASGTFPCMEHKPGSMGKPVPGWHIELPR